MQMSPIDPTALLIAAVIGGVFLLILIALLIVVIMRGSRERTRADDMLANLAAMQAASQSDLNQRITDQERAVGERLERLGHRVGESLNTTSEKNQATLAQLHERLAVMQEAHRNIMELSTQMVGLQDILSNKQSRGAFGEVQLEDLVRQVLAPDMYDFQVTIGDNKRVDCLLRLPDPPGSICIDSKFPLESYQNLLGGPAEVDKTPLLRAFKAAVIKHVRDISEKYIVPGETAEWAMMFLPSEAVYAEIQTNHRDVVERSHRERVAIVSPNTMWATLNTVRAVFRDVRVREQAHRIQEEMDSLLGDIGRLDDRVAKLDQHFGLARKDIEQIHTSSKKISNRAGRMRDMELGGPTDSDAPDNAPRIATKSPGADFSGDTQENGAEKTKGRAKRSRPGKSQGGRGKESGSSVDPDAVDSDPKVTRLPTARRPEGAAD